MTRELELHNRRRLDCSAERRRQTFAFSGCAVHRCRVAVAPRTGAELGVSDGRGSAGVRPPTDVCRSGALGDVQQITGRRMFMRPRRRPLSTIVKYPLTPRPKHVSADMPSLCLVSWQ